MNSGGHSSNVLSSTRPMVRIMWRRLQEAAIDRTTEPQYRHHLVARRIGVDQQIIGLVKKIERAPSAGSVK